MWLQSTVYGMGFALALIVAKKRKLLGDTGASQSGLCRVFIWAAGFLSVIGLVVSTALGLQASSLSSVSS